MNCFHDLSFLFKNIGTVSIVYGKFCYFELLNVLDNNLNDRDKKISF
jgi:hypothetical protein